MGDFSRLADLLLTNDLDTALRLLDRVSGLDPYLEIARGKVEGQSHVNKFGRNDTILSAGSAEDIWDGGGTYSFPSSALITKLVQATDQVGTDGNATIEIQGLDTNWNLKVQTADLDGTDTTTEVTLGTPLRRVFRMKCLEDLILADDVSVVGGGTIYSTIKAGNNQTLMAIYTVPAGKTAYMTKYYGTINKGGAKTPDAVTLKMFQKDNANGYPKQLKHVIGMEAGGETILEHDFKPYYKVTEKTDIWLEGTAIGSAVTADVSAGFDLILVNN